LTAPRTSFSAVTLSQAPEPVASMIGDGTVNVRDSLQTSDRGARFRGTTHTGNFLFDHDGLAYFFFVSLSVIFSSE
jgi:hypothetical protein